MVGSVSSVETFNTSTVENGDTSTNHSTSREITGSSTFSSLEQLKREAPKIYNQALLGIGMTMCNKIRRGQERIKKILREEQHAIARK